MPRLLCLIAFVLGTFAAVAFADQPAIIVTQQGYFFLSVGGDGAPVIDPVERVIDLRDGGAPGPTDPTEPEDDPEPSPDLELTRAARDWAAAIDDPSTAQSLSLVYRQIAAAVQDDTLSVEAGITALREATDVVLVSLGRQTKWEPFRGKASQALTDRRQRGEMASHAQLERFMVAVAHGLELAADGSAAIEFAAIIAIAAQVNQAIDGATK